MMTQRMASGGTAKAIAIAGNAMLTIESSETTSAPPAAIHRVMRGMMTRGRPARDGSDHAGGMGALRDLPSAREVRHVHHLALPRERPGATLGVLLERADERESLFGIRSGRRELLVDRLDLPGMDRDLADESHRDAVLTFTSEPLDVGDVRVHGIDCLDTGCRRGHGAHHPRVARNIQIPPLGVAHARQAHDRREI